MPTRLLIIDNNPAREREKTIANGGRGDVDCYRQVLSAFQPAPTIDVVSTAEDDGSVKRVEPGTFDGFVWTGSAMSVNGSEPTVVRARELLETAIREKVPCFGSCWGLQLAAVTLGGTVAKAARGPQIKLETQIWQTDLGRSHPMLASKPRWYEAVQVHMEEIKALPQCSTLLASSKDTEVEAAEIATDGWRFWGTQYHPEFNLHDLGAQLRVEGETLVEQGAYQSLEEIAKLASAFRHATPEDLTRHHGADPSILEDRLRSLEIRNWLASLSTAAST